MNNKASSSELKEDVSSTKMDSLGTDIPSEIELYKRIMLTNELAWQKKFLTKDEIDIWLSNFKGEVLDIKYERQLALWLLSNFVYYNENEVRHLCKTMYREFIHRMLIDEDKYKFLDVKDKLESIRHASRFYHVGRAGESGAYILYYFRQENQLPNEFFIEEPKKIPPYVDKVVFIDDVTISGTQALKYLDRETMEYDIDKRKILLTFISTNEAEWTAPSKWTTS